jgi:hypothetical protein
MNLKKKREEKINVTDYASGLGLKLGFDKILVSDVPKGIAYYSVAVKKDKLPEDFQALEFLTKGVQVEKYGNNLVDFEPIVLKDAKGNIINIDQIE